MSKSYRIKAKPNEDKNIFVNLEQDFDQLEILSLKIVKSDAYSRTCADYGVVVGRAQANGGFGIPKLVIKTKRAIGIIYYLKFRKAVTTMPLETFLLQKR